jgi:predicted small lipoprotein YifL
VSGKALAALALFALTGCGGSDDFVTPPAAVTLLDVQTQVFTPRCALSGCHVSVGAPFGLDLSSVTASAASTVNVASAEMPSLMRIDPFDPAQSYLYLKITDDPSILGDPMPASGGPLSSADIALVEEWIAGGAH